MDDQGRAVSFILVSAVCFTVMGAFAKAAPAVPVWDKVLFRNLVTLVVALVVLLRRRHRPLLGSWCNQPFLLTRSLLGIGGVACYFYAIDNLYLADAVMLNMLSPFVVAVVAVPVLRESLTRPVVVAQLVAFAGGLLVLKPRFDLSVLPALAGLGSAVLAGCAYVTVRALRQREPTETIVLHFSALTAVIMLPLVLHDLRLPSPLEALWMLGVGISAAGGQLSLTAAYRYAPAAEVSIFSHARIILSALLALAIWSEVPDRQSIIGGTLIISGGALAFLYGNSKKRHGVSNQRGGATTK